MLRTAFEHLVALEKILQSNKENVKGLYLRLTIFVFYEFCPSVRKAVFCTLACA